MVMLGEVLRQENYDEDVGRCDEDEDDAGEDCEIFIPEAPVPDEDPGEVEYEVQGQSHGDSWGQDVGTEIKPASGKMSTLIQINVLNVSPSKIRFYKNGHNKVEETEGQPQVDHSPDGKCET